MENTPKLGTLAPDDARRDAIHVAVSPATAGERLSPGEHVGFISGQTEVATADTDKPIGIVDPYLKSPVRKGQRFWLCLYPQTVTSLRHEWTHPEFDNDEPQRIMPDSEKWLRDFAEEVGVSYGVLMDAAESWLEEKDYYTLNRDTPDCVYTHREEFWEHYEKVTGKEIKDKQATFFSCAC